MKAAVALGMALVLLGAPASADPANLILIEGAATGSNLKLSESEGRLVVQGATEAAGTIGCARLRGQGEASCPLAGVQWIEVRTGATGDRVRVLDPLPVPVIAHLGAGSDKFIGNAEPDTCYSEGSRRNRCIGGGGDDTCITGAENSDCVGGPGNDICRHGAGSDGCWGGPGNDTCLMGAGDDGCHGGPGNDRLFGGPGEDQLYGGPGIDYCDGGPGRGQSHQCERGPGG